MPSHYPKPKPVGTTADKLSDELQMNLAGRQWIRATTWLTFGPHLNLGCLHEQERFVSFDDITGATLNIGAIFVLRLVTANCTLHKHRLHTNITQTSMARQKDL